MTQNTPTPSTTQQSTEASSTRRRYEITSQDLPISCPTKDMRLWDGHPRVWLPLEKTGHEICPYCDAEFILTDFHAHTPETDANSST